MLYNHRSPYWTKEEDAKLCALWREGISGGLIAEQFPRRSRSGVLGRAKRLGLKGRDPVVVRKAEYRERRANPVPKPVRRDPCVKCGVRGDIGCRHQEAA